MLKALLNCFASISDYRVLGRTKYTLTEILFIVFIGVLTGCRGWKAIHSFAVSNAYWFKKHLPGLVDIPSVDTLARTISNLDPKALTSGFPKLGKDFLRLSPRTKRKIGRPIKGVTP
jgi:H+/Cl- antiporter ClcA